MDLVTTTTNKMSKGEWGLIGAVVLAAILILAWGLTPPNEPDPPEQVITTPLELPPIPEPEPEPPVTPEEVVVVVEPKPVDPLAEYPEEQRKVGQVLATMISKCDGLNGVCSLEAYRNNSIDYEKAGELYSVEFKDVFLASRIFPHWRVEYEKNSALLSNQDTARLIQAAQDAYQKNNNQKVTLFIIASSSPTGPRQKNYELGIQRADAPYHAIRKALNSGGPLHALTGQIDVHRTSLAADYLDVTICKTFPDGSESKLECEKSDPMSRLQAAFIIAVPTDLVTKIRNSPGLLPQVAHDTRPTSHQYKD